MNGKLQAYLQLFAQAMLVWLAYVGGQHILTLVGVVNERFTPLISIGGSLIFYGAALTSIFLGIFRFSQAFQVFFPPVDRILIAVFAILTIAPSFHLSYGLYSKFYGHRQPKHESKFEELRQEIDEVFSTSRIKGSKF